MIILGLSGLGGNDLKQNPNGSIEVIIIQPVSLVLCENKMYQYKIKSHNCSGFVEKRILLGIIPAPPPLHWI